MAEKTIHLTPLENADLPIRGERVAGIAPLNGKIVWVGTALEAVAPGVRVTKNTTLAQYVLADVFSPDLGERRQSFFAFREKGTLLHGETSLYAEGGRLFLNTFSRRWSFSCAENPETFRAQVLANILEITEDEIRLAGPAPFPENLYVPVDAREYRFGDLAVRMTSQFRMECRSVSSGAALWTLKLSAYLYTEIERRKERLYFGTAGNGGRFYCVSLADGRVIYEYNNGGAVRYLRLDDLVILSDRKGGLVFIDAESGAEQDRVRFPKMKIMSDETPMLIHGGQLYTTVYREEKTKTRQYAARVGL